MSASAQTRTTQTRTLQKRKAVYKPPSDLGFPEEMLKFYHNKGFKLRWVRFSTAGEPDMRNLARYKREGWQWVTKSEIPEECKDMFSTQKIETNNQVICQGDLILAKIEAEQSDARQEYYQQQSMDAVESTRREARNTGGNDRMDKYTPIIDETQEPTYTVK